jgi:hypothetical protein
VRVAESMAVLGSLPSPEQVADAVDHLSVVSSRRLPTGRLFEPVHEARMWPDLLALANTVGARHQHGGVAISELRTPYGVPDLTVILPDERHFSARLGSDVPPLLNEIDAAIVASLSSRYGRDQAEVGARLGWAEEAFAHRIPFLIRQGAAMVGADGRLRRHASLSTLGRVHAFEAKIKDWTRAFQQARRYSLWADYVTVVIDQPGEWLDDAKHLAKHRGVGLAVGSSWLVRPRLTKRPDARRLWASEHLAAALREY